jgi:hypothetical protein
LADGSYALDFDNQPTGFNVTNLSVMLNKEFEVEGISVPAQFGYVYNPTSKCHYVLLKAGLSF